MSTHDQTIQTISFNLRQTIDQAVSLVCKKAAVTHMYSTEVMTVISCVGSEKSATGITQQNN